MEEAVELVENKVMSIRKAAKTFGVPKTTLLRKIQQRSLPEKHPEIPITILTEENNENVIE